MSWNLTTFRNGIGNPARNHLYEVRIPVGILNLAPVFDNSKIKWLDVDVLTAMSRGTEMPGVSVSTTTVSYRSHEIKYIGKPIYNDWTVSFMCDEDHKIRNFLIWWIKAIISSQYTIMEVGDIYKIDGISVSQLKLDGTLASTCVLYGAFPTSIGGIQFDQQGGQISTFDATFTYDYFLMNDLNGNVVSPTTYDIVLDNLGRQKGVV